MHFIFCFTKQLQRRAVLFYNYRMEIKRFFVENTKRIALGDLVEVGGEEFRHAIKVSRYKVGYTLILSNGDGYDYFAKIPSFVRWKGRQRTPTNLQNR